MRDRAADFGGGVVDTLADRARDVGGLALEAFTSDPNIGRMTTAEFSQAADRPTPRLDQAAQELGTIGKAIVTQPVQTGKALVQGEVERARQAMTSPRAAGEYAGSMVDPMRIAAALRKTAPIAELDVYHGTPHRFEPTEENPLGEFDASKIGTGEGAQAYGHGVYLAESPDVAKGYAANVKDMGSVKAINAEMSVLANIMHTDEVPGSYRKYKTDAGREAAKRYDELMAQRQKVVDSPGSFYKADLPDQMIDRMLDWDKPLSEQSPYVQKIIGEEIKRIGGGSTLSTGEKAYKELMFQARMEGAESGNSAMKNNAQAIAASKRLKELGIPGIRYLDRQSRIYGKPKFFVENVSADGKVINSFRFDTREEAEKFSATFKKQMKRQLPPEKIGTPRITEREAQQTTSNFVVFPGEEKKVKILKRD
jgi:hypothetical protein